MQELRCKKCGTFLKKEDEMYICPACGARYKAENARRVADEMARLLGEQKQEAVANLRRQLWRETHEEFINDAEISRLARAIKGYLPDDWFATFCDLACGGSDARLNAFLGEADVSAQSMYVWDVVRLMLHLLKESNLLAVNDFLARAGNAGTDMEQYDRYNRQLIREAEKIDRGVYDVLVPRDAFIAYKSEDMEKVIELVEELERQGLKCFVAARNLQHGAVRHYEEKLFEAMDHCKTVVFVSSTRSRSRRCDALSVELPYVRQKDIDGAPAQLRNYYEKLPAEYKKPRVEYVIEPYKGGDAAEAIVNEFFAGYERCYNVAEVARRVLEYVASAPASNVKYCLACGTENPKKTKFCIECGGREFAATREEAERAQRAKAEAAAREAEAVRRAEEERRHAEEEKQRAEEEKKRAEEERRRAAEAQKKAEEEAAALRAELERLKKAAQEAASKPAAPQKPAPEPAAPAAPAPVQPPKPASEPTPESEPEFEIKEGVLLKYNGAGGEVVVPDGVTAIEFDAFRAQNALRRVVLPHGITRIGDNAFGYSQNLEEVVIPDTVTEIGEYAFESCVALKALYLPEGLTKVHDAAFLGCQALKSVVIPGSLARIPAYAFSGCSALERVTLREGVKRIGDYAFVDCSHLAQVDLPASIENIAKRAFQNCRNLKNEPTLAAASKPVPAPAASADEDFGDFGEIEIPDPAKPAPKPAPESKPEFEIKDGVLLKYNGTGGNVVIPDGVTAIGRAAFYGCKSLTNVTIPNSVTEIKGGTVLDGAFRGCTSLISISIPNRVTKIGRFSFYGCKSLTSVTIPNSVTQIESNTFGGCTSLASITIPNSVTHISDQAFYGCVSLTNITIPKSVTSIWSRAFSCCTKAEFHVETGNSAYHVSGNCLIETRSKRLIAGCNKSVIPMDGSVVRIEDGAFERCSELSGITIPNGVTDIGYHAFQGCTGLTSIVIPDSVKTISAWAFDGCTGLTSVFLSGIVSAIGDGAFRGCGKAKIYCACPQPAKLPVNWYAELKKRRILWNASKPESAPAPMLQPAEKSAAAPAPKPAPAAQQKKPAQKSAPVSGGMGGHPDMYMPKASPLSDFEIENGVLKKYKGKGGKVVIPNNVTCIGSFSFKEEPLWLKTISLMSDLARNGVKAIKDDIGLTSVVIPNSVTIIESHAFFFCTGLTSITIPDSVESIGGLAFEGCYELKSITIPAKAVKIGTDAFKGCDKAKIYCHRQKPNRWPDGWDKSLQDRIIWDQPQPTPVAPAPAAQTPAESLLSEFLIKNGVLEKYKGKGGNVVIPDGVKRIGWHAFEGCAGLMGIRIPNSVTRIGEGAFKGCTGLTSITIPNSVKSIEDSTFSSCTGLTSIAIPKSVMSIGVGAFYGCTGLPSITIPISVTNIGGSAFFGCERLTSITIPDGVTSIADSVFCGCTSLTNVVIPKDVTEIGWRAFDNCKSLKSVTIPQNVQNIDAYAFPFGCKVYCHRKKPFPWPKGWHKDLKGRIIWDK